jgi:hypothetical protein
MNAYHSGSSSSSLSLMCSSWSGGGAAAGAAAAPCGPAEPFALESPQPLAAATPAAAAAAAAAAAPPLPPPLVDAAAGLPRALALPFFRVGAARTGLGDAFALTMCAVDAAGSVCTAGEAVALDPVASSVLDALPAAATAADGLAGDAFAAALAIAGSAR